MVSGAERTLRRGEIAGLRWADVDFDAGTIFHRAEARWWGAGIRRREENEDVVGVVPHAAAGRGAGCRPQARLHPTTRRTRWRSAQHTPTAAMWRSTRRGAVHAGHATRMWHKLAESAGVRPIRLHDARHSCRTALPPPRRAAGRRSRSGSATPTRRHGRIYPLPGRRVLRAAGQSLGAVDDILATPRLWARLIHMERDLRKRTSEPVSVMPPAGIEPAAWCLPGRSATSTDTRPAAMTAIGVVITSVHKMP